VNVSSLNIADISSDLDGFIFPQFTLNNGSIISINDNGYGVYDDQNGLESFIPNLANASYADLSDDDVFYTILVGSHEP